MRCSAAASRILEREQISDIGLFGAGPASGWRGLSNGIMYKSNSLAGKWPVRITVVNSCAKTRNVSGSYLNISTGYPYGPGTLLDARLHTAFATSSLYTGSKSIVPFMVALGRTRGRGGV